MTSAIYPDLFAISTETKTEAMLLFRTRSKMITPPIPTSLLHLTGQAVEKLKPSPDKAPRLRPGKTYITAFSVITGLLLVVTLTDLPLLIQGLLGGMLGLVIYGMVAASFSQMRFGLLVGLLALTGFNLMQGLVNLDMESQYQAMFWAQSASEEFHELFSNPDEYHLLVDELFISQACWKKHAKQLKPLQSQ